MRRVPKIQTHRIHSEPVLNASSESEISTLFNSHPEITQRDTRYLPRFPMISIISEARLSEVQFEQAAGRIIDVILAEDDSNLLLIDSLGIDLSDGWM
jgi:hypothetical protein